MSCVNLRNISFPEGVEAIERCAFSENNFRDVEFPASLRKIGQGAFAKCCILRTAKFHEGLEVLGTSICPDDED